MFCLNFELVLVNLRLHFKLILKLTENKETQKLSGKIKAGWEPRFGKAMSAEKFKFQSRAIC